MLPRECRKLLNNGETAEVVGFYFAFCMTTAENEQGFGNRHCNDTARQCTTAFAVHSQHQIKRVQPLARALLLDSIPGQIIISSRGRVLPPQATMFALRSLGPHVRATARVPRQAVAFQQKRGMAGGGTLPSCWGFYLQLPALPAANLQPPRTSSSTACGPGSEQHARARQQRRSDALCLSSSLQTMRTPACLSTGGTTQPTQMHGTSTRCV